MRLSFALLKRLDAAADNLFSATEEIRRGAGGAVLPPDAYLRRLARPAVYPLTSGGSPTYGEDRDASEVPTEEPIFWKALVPLFREMCDGMSPRPGYIALLMEEGLLLGGETRQAFTFAACHARPTDAWTEINTYLDFSTSKLLFSESAATPLWIDWTAGSNSRLAPAESAHYVQLCDGPTNDLKLLKACPAILKTVEALAPSETPATTLIKAYSKIITGYRKHLSHGPRLPSELFGLFIPAHLGGRPLAAAFLLFDTSGWNQDRFDTAYDDGHRVSREVAGVLHQWHRLASTRNIAISSTATAMVEWMNHETNLLFGDLHEAADNLSDWNTGRPARKARTSGARSAADNAVDIMRVAGTLIRSMAAVGGISVQLLNERDSTTRRTPDDVADIVQRMNRYFAGLRGISASRCASTIDGSLRTLPIHVQVVSSELIRNAWKNYEPHDFGVSVDLRKTGNDIRLAVSSGPHPHDALARLRAAMIHRDKPKGTTGLGWWLLNQWAAQNGWGIVLSPENPQRTVTVSVTFPDHATSGSAV
jgi:hypothetical protein